MYGSYLHTNFLSIFSQRNFEEMVMINGEGGGDDRRHHHHQHLQEDLYDRDFPPGYRFKPTDQELIKVYLFQKVNSFLLPPNRFVEVNIYSCSPWKLAAKYKSYGESVHYFFTPRDKKYPNGDRPSRAAGVGYWKACGASKPVRDELTDKIIGYKRGLVFYRGKPAIGKKTNWIMHEYTLEKPEEKEEKKKKNDNTITTTSSSYNGTGSRRKNKKRKLLCPDPENPKNKQLDEFVLCKLYLKPGKSTTKYPDGDPLDEDITQENNTDVAAPSSSMATATTSSAAVPENYPSMATATTSAAVQENYHQMHQYASTSMVVGAAAVVEEMVPVNNYLPHMHQSVVAAPVDHQSSLTSMLKAPATQEEMILFSNGNYSDNINPSTAVSSLAILPSINLHYGQDAWEWETLGDQWINDIDFQPNLFGPTGWLNDIDSQSNVLGSVGFSVPADIRPK